MKRKIIFSVIGFLVLAFIIMQFFRPEKNDAKVTTDEIIFQLDIPAGVRKTIVASCYDCHSNQTQYPWYANIAPVSWMLANHVKEGKEKLNFSDWKNYSRRDQIGLLDEICEVVTNEEMPLKSYLLMHSNAILLEHQKKELCDWTSEAAATIMQKKE